MNFDPNLIREVLADTAMERLQLLQLLKSANDKIKSLEAKLDEDKED